MLRVLDLYCLTSFLLLNDCFYSETIRVFESRDQCKWNGGDGDVMLQDVFVQKCVLILKSRLHPCPCLSILLVLLFGLLDYYTLFTALHLYIFLLQ